MEELSLKIVRRERLFIILLIINNKIIIKNLSLVYMVLVIKYICLNIF